MSGSPTSSGEDSDNDFDESHRDAALNLLDIANPSRWRNLNPTESSNPSEDKLPTQIANGSTANSDQIGDQSIIKVFEPKFLEVYNEFVYCSKEKLDLSKHLMVVCLEMIIPFCCWARDIEHVDWIHTTLDGNADLRPEVRNGLAMVLIYVFSAAQAEASHSDMFTVLQDLESGMGIVNKTSLKIYNDPFHYFKFLKSCISGLIDAGKIPENERQNQPKKAKRSTENKEELIAFDQMKRVLVAWLIKEDHTSVRSRIGQIMTLWQQRQKTIRGRRFAMAVQLLSSTNAASRAKLGLFDPLIDPLVVGLYGPALVDQSTALVGLSPKVANAVDGFEAQSTSVKGGTLLPSSFSLEPIDTSTKLLSSATAQTTVPPPSTTAASSAIRSILSPIKADRSAHTTGRKPSGLSIRAITLYRFERIGNNEWEYKEMKVFNVEALINQHTSGSFHLIDESKLTAEEQSSKQLSRTVSGLTSIAEELHSRSALLTSWGKDEHAHLLDFLGSWADQQPHPSNMLDSNIRSSTLLQHWYGMTSQGKDNVNEDTVLGKRRRSETGDFNGESSRAGTDQTMDVDSTAKELEEKTDHGIVSGQGVIVFEVVQQVGLILRRSPSLHIDEDCWRLVFPRDFRGVDDSLTIGQYLSALFPQLRVSLKKGADPSSIVVKYYAHTNMHGLTSTAMTPSASAATVSSSQFPLSASAMALPTIPDPTSYQTVATLGDSMVSMLSRLETSVLFHDFLLREI